MPNDITDQPPGQALESLQSILNDDTLTLSEAVDWTGDPDNLPDPSRQALEANVALSKQFAGVTGTAIDPATGEEQPRKNLLMKASANR